MTRQARVIEDLRHVGVRAGAVLLVHASFRAVRPVEGGADGLIDALLESVAPGGTLAFLHPQVAGCAECDLARRSIGDAGPPRASLGS